MELSIIRGGGGGMIAPNSSLQAAALSGAHTVLCPSKTTPSWQLLPTHHPNTTAPLCMHPTTVPPGLISHPIDIPKETIIANTDFTTTSLIAKRRLSSKKRRQQQAALLSSPTQHSANNHTPSTVTIATTTPSLLTTSLSSSQPIAVGGVGPSPPQLIAVPAPQYIHDTGSQVVHTSSLPSRQPKVIKSDNNSSTKEKTFQWSSAHIFIAHRIKQHQTQLKQNQLHHNDITSHQLNNISSHGHTTIASNTQGHTTTASNTQGHLTGGIGHYDNNALAALIQQQHIQQYQQQQQLILLQQLYGSNIVPSTTAGAPQVLSLPPPLDHSALHYHILTGGQNSSQTQQQPQIVGFHIPAGIYQGGGGSGVPISFPVISNEATYFPTTSQYNLGGSWVTPVPAAVIAPIQTGRQLLPASSWVK